MVAVPLLVTSAMLLSQPASSHGYRSQHITNDILTFAKTRNIGSIVILTCWPLGAKSEAALLMSQHGIMVSFSIKTILNSKRKPDQRSGAVIDFSCPKAAFLVRNVFVWDLFDAGTDWLVVAEEWPSEKPATERLLEAFQNVFPSSDSNVFLSVENKMENCTDACRKKLFEVYGGATVPVEGYSFQVDWNRRSDLRSALLRTCTVVRTSGKELATKTPDSLMEMDVWALMHASVIEILSHQLNFRYEMYFVNDYGWSFNGNYSGLMGLFQRGKIDLTATGIFTRPDRLPLVDYTVETFQIRRVI
ncbi:hypothetical protein AAG570_000374 [Ranatra chinensis]|uniref:Uncharacterized protein n=1 Tax=Ranatra chinensis TaxID=642074 RepID=A0ABD0Z7A2_9HEMI